MSAGSLVLLSPLTLKVCMVIMQCSSGLVGQKDGAARKGNDVQAVQSSLASMNRPSARGQHMHACNGPVEWAACAAGTNFISVKASHIHLHELVLRQKLQLRHIASLPMPNIEEKAWVNSVVWAPDSSMVLVLMEFNVEVV